MEYKICSKCGERFEATTEFFHKARHHKDGLCSHCKICRNQVNKKYSYNQRRDPVCLEKVRKRDREYYCERMKNTTYREKTRQHYREYNKINRERIKQQHQEWIKNNPDKCNVYVSDRRARKLNQTSPDANKELIQFYYTVCSTMKDYHVDHIQPLSKGGLHHQDNLQLLEKHLNLEKHNKWPLTPEEEIKYKGLKL